MLISVVGLEEAEEGRLKEEPARPLSPSLPSFDLERARIPAPARYPPSIEHPLHTSLISIPSIPPSRMQRSFGGVLTSLSSLSQPVDLSDDLLDQGRPVSLSDLLQISKRGNVSLSLLLRCRSSEVGKKLERLEGGGTRTRRERKNKGRKNRARQFRAQALPERRMDSSPAPQRHRPHRW